MKKLTVRGGFYWKGKTPYIRVTKPIDILDKPALRYWFGKEIYLAMVKDPTLDEKEAMSSPWKTSGKARKRGAMIHSLIEAYKVSKAKVEPPIYKGYAKAFYAWVDKVKPQIIAQERQVVSEKYKYAGTLDMLAKIKGKRYVIDFKTNEKGNIYNEVGLQLSAYKQAVVENGEKVDGMMAVALAKNGTFAEKTFKDVLKIYLKVKDIWVWLNAKKCETLGYKSK